DELRLGGVTLRYAVRFRAAYPDWRPAVKFLAWPLALGAGCCLVAPDAWRMFFLLALAAFWLGCDGAARAGPSPPPGAGPLVRLAAVGLGRGFLLRGVALPFPRLEGGVLVPFAVLSLLGWAGSALGLLLANLTANADRGRLAAAVALLPQFLLAGVL